MERRDGVLQETVNQGIHLHLPGFRSNESFILLMFNRDFKTSSVQIDNYTWFYVFLCCDIQYKYIYFNFYGIWTPLIIGADLLNTSTYDIFIS